ncbi:thioredoxin [Phlyctochytrium arcticum]|nr:thioredoxin [Phlyctochytrium arcticum]
MGGKVIVVASNDEFNSHINGDKPVIGKLDFFATWCGPCKMISPKFEQFSETYTSVVFLKVDVDEVPDVAEVAGVRAMPTFHVYKKGEKVSEVVGADPARLEAEIKKYASES